MSLPRRRLALAALLLLGACGTTEAAPPVHHPVQLGEAERETVARFVGKWQHVGGPEDRDEALAAVEAVTGQMSSLIRGMARSRLEDSVRIDATLEIAEADGIVTITRSESPRPFSAPADGTVFELVNDEGDDARGSLRIDGFQLRTRVETDQGGGERAYRIDATGQLVITTRIFSPRLPGDVVFDSHYQRP